MLAQRLPMKTPCLVIMSLLLQAAGALAQGSHQTLTGASAADALPCFAEALRQKKQVVALVEGGASSRAEDYVLKSGLNLMLSNFPRLHSQNKVKLARLVTPVKGEFERVVVYREVAALTSDPIFLPPPGTTWLVVLQEPAPDGLRIAWPEVPDTLPVYELPNKSLGILQIADPEAAKPWIEDMRDLAKALEQQKSVTALKLRSDLGAKLQAEVIRQAQATSESRPN
jgi:hypothetical protein